MRDFGYGNVLLCLVCRHTFIKKAIKFVLVVPNSSVEGQKTWMELTDGWEEYFQTFSDLAKKS